MENIFYSIPLAEFRDLLKKCIREEISSTLPGEKEDELLKTEDAIKLLRTSKVTLLKWRKKGLIPYHRIASRIYFKRSELIESLNNFPKRRTR